MEWLGRSSARTMAMLGSAAAQLLGTTCPGCATSHWGCCANCRAQLMVPHGVGGVQRDLAVGDRVVPVWSTTHYLDPVPQLIRSWKDAQAWTLAGPFADGLAGLLSGLARPDQQVTLVPVSSAVAAVRRRHYDQTLALSRALARRRAGPTRVIRALRRRGRVRDQRVLGRDQRWTNQRHTMTFVPAWHSGGSAGRRPDGLVLLVDDVVTTGATLTEAARCLTAAGWWPDAALTIAQTPKHHSGGIGS